MAADLEFFLDPICPWAWITSRWVREVQDVRGDSVEWRFICLAMVNEQASGDWYTAERRAGHRLGLAALRVTDQVRIDHGNDGVAAFYTAVGTAWHTNSAGPADYGSDPTTSPAVHASLADALGAAGLDQALAAHAADDTHDEYLRAETEAALGRTGRDVGTPIITFHPGAGNEATFFGPVIASIPRGDEAVRLWDAIEVIATTSGMAELKRSLRARPDFS